MELVELLGAAYRGDRNSVSFPTDHPNNANMDPSILSKSDVILAVEVPDLVSSFGLRNYTGGYGLGEGTTLIDLSAAELDYKSWSSISALAQPSSLRLWCDPVECLEALLASLKASLAAEGTSGRGKRIKRLHRDLSEKRSIKTREYALREKDRPISQVRLVSELWNAVKDTKWILGLRNTRTWPEGIWKFSGAGEFLGHSGGGGVGHGPGAMVGCALAALEQGKLGVGIIGNGDFLMASAALWTAIHYRIPMLLVINDNGSFYNDEPHQERVAIDRARPAANSWIGMRIGDPDIDLASLAKSYGCWSIGPIDDLEELGGVFAEAVSRGERIHLRSPRAYFEVVGQPVEPLRIKLHCGYVEYKVLLRFGR